MSEPLRPGLETCPLREAQGSPDPALGGIDPAQAHHQVYCPTCSSRLEDSRCKLICRTCGYFLSCADFY